MIEKKLFKLLFIYNMIGSDLEYILGGMTK